ncbi:MAG: hypothetical protein NW223_02440 [Hyphomicrobiaceae bacterium]|nr:hypothetical protein [Hyphomicrobiaceae bacterium]
MSGLLRSATAYAQSGGYVLARQEADFAHLEAGTLIAPRPALLIWASDAVLEASERLSAAKEAERTQREQALLARMSAETARVPGAVGYYLVPSRLGLSKDFISSVTRSIGRDGTGGVRVPAEFFDTPYKIEGSQARKARSMLAQVLKLAERPRVAQPFFVRSGLGHDERSPGEGDLVEFMDGLLREPSDGAHLYILDGPAGGGKTVAFNALTSAIYGEFIAAKGRDIVRRRPLVFLPEHLRGFEIGYVDDIVDAVADAEIAGGVETEQLHWLLRHGHAIWMLDGLDEVYAGDNDFFDFIERALADPESQAQIFLCTRDSLMSSSPRMRAFLERRMRPGGKVSVYELAPWGAASWRQIAWMELESGRASARDSARVAGFTQALAAASDLAGLASLPFYCALLIELYRSKGRMPADRLELLDYIVERMLDREQGKGIFRWRDFVNAEIVAEAMEERAEALGIRLLDGSEARTGIASAFEAEGRRSVLEILGAIAHNRLQNGDGEAGLLDAETIRALLGPSYVSDRLEAEDNDRVLYALVQFAFFGAGRKAGLVDFSHPILAEYLAGLYAASLLAAEAQAHAAGRASLNQSRSAIRQALGGIDVGESSPFVQVLQRAIGSAPALRELLRKFGDEQAAPILRRLLH